MKAPLILAAVLTLNLLSGCSTVNRTADAAERSDWKCAGSTVAGAGAGGYVGNQLGCP